MFTCCTLYASLPTSSSHCQSFSRAQPQCSAHIHPCFRAKMLKIIYHSNLLFSGLPKPAALAAQHPLPKGNTLFLPALGLPSHTAGSRTVLQPVELWRCDPEAHERHLLLLCCLCCHNSHSPSNKYVLQLFWELHCTESFSTWTQTKPVQFSLC